jgi:predicted nucleic acid-binding protein
LRDRVYVETTIVSYLAARLSRDLIVAAHQQLTEEWWLQRRSSFDLFTSQVVVREAAAGDREIAQRRLDLLAEIPLLAIDDAALELAKRLLHRGMIPARAAEDASHIAIATIHGMDYLLTWNCKHIANAQMQKAVAEICRAAGYEPPTICTPEELMGE